MEYSYVLIRCDSGMKNAVVAHLKKIHGITEINDSEGAYDILVKVESTTKDHLRAIIGWKIQKMSCVQSILRLGHSKKI